MKSTEIEVHMDGPNPFVIAPVGDPNAVEAALPRGWTVGDSWWASLADQKLPDGRWKLYLMRVSHVGGARAPHPEVIARKPKPQALDPQQRKAADDACRWGMVSSKTATIILDIDFYRSVVSALANAEEQIESLQWIAAQNQQHRAQADRLLRAAVFEALQRKAFTNTRCTRCGATGGMLMEKHWCAGMQACGVFLAMRDEDVVDSIVHEVLAQQSAAQK